MKKLSISDKIWCVVMAFTPWILVIQGVIFFIPTAAQTSFQIAIVWVGIFWVILSPIFILLMMFLFYGVLKQKYFS